MNNLDPNDQKTKFCIYCGKKIPINAKKCSYCFQWLDDEISSEKSYNNINTRVATPSYKNNEEYSKIIPMRRFYLLMILTMGLYSIYWFYKNSSYLRDEFGKDISVGLRTLAFAIIPIANIIVFYELLNEMERIIKKKGIETYSSGLNILIWLFVPFVGMWVYINIQESFNDFWRIQEPHLPVRREFDNGEILVMVFTTMILSALVLLYIFFLVYILSNP
ncbi:MAG: hypothetical protein LBU74_05075 [Methanobacteriaceae archaeon]|jgi:hypothetical protein|nr:hypothetical protein [Candidatus Methanorudis spinitermitis]